ncbi:MAG TPA: hypothetical protein PKE45_09665, partial [Caldilineaceae bacterium]|nr:hypothetical protein [Caldilineaceae bacterium]
VNFMLNDEQSGIMNIADAVYEAWKSWNDSGGAKGDDATFDGEAEVHWEAGYGDTGSYYTGDSWNEITIADDPSDPDQWDDSVIMHEWGHMADDYYGCDDNGGGPHNVDTLVSDLELSWGEGYPDYYQSAVRALTGHPDPSWYIDTNAAGGINIGVNLETYDSTRMASLLSDQNELAIAAMLWDLNDNANDGRTVGGMVVGPWDRVSYGHATNQEVYTDSTFESNGDIFDDDCTSYVYLWAWKQIGKATDAGTAEAATKNIGRANPFSGLQAQVTASGIGSGATIHAGSPYPPDYRWWRQLTMVTDNSASMGAEGKLDAVKTVMKETINDVVVPDPKGIEVAVNTFNNASGAIQPVLSGQFFPEGITPYIDNLTAIGAADPNCQVNALSALSQAIANQRGGQAWLYTDGDTYLSPSLPLIQQRLNERQVRGSFALLGGCGSPARKPSEVSGAEEDYLQLAADGSQSSGIVPYLLTALTSGGQFLYVNKDQLADAADILRAQLANSAGAGKWSDYVSDLFTYRWDRLTSREYQWFPAESLGQDAGQLPEDGLTINLPNLFPFYGANQSSVSVSQDGYLQFEPCTLDPQFCPFPLFTNYLDILDTDMTWEYIPKPPAVAAASADTPQSPQEYGYQVHVYTANFGINEWVIISTQGIGYYGGNDNAPRAYQVWLNTQTGEIRYQYQRVRNEAASAEIGLEVKHLIGDDEKLLVSDHDVAGASNDMGYKFTPAPPAPNRTYTVAVDSLINSVGFMQTGYSGSFEPMIVTDPAGNPVNCAAPSGVLCLTVDHIPGDRMVQYVQVDTGGQGGNWHALIDAGASGEGTFSFNALAASALNPTSPNRRLLPSQGIFPLFVDMGRTTTGGVLTGWFQTPAGQRFGDEFTLFDDGGHGDGRANDGLFNLPDLTPPGRGVGFLWLRGTVEGVDFVRSDPTPFNFQPLRVSILQQDLPNNNETVQLSVLIENLDSRDLCIYPEVVTPDGWSYDWDFDELGCLNIPAGQVQGQVLTIFPAWPDARSGEKAEITVAFAEAEEGAISANTAASLIRYRPGFHLEFDTRYADIYLRPNSSDVISLTAILLDDQGFPVADDTLVQFDTTLGEVALPITAAQAASAGAVFAGTRSGRATVLFTPGGTVGDAVVTAIAGSLTATTTIHIRNPVANQIELAVTPTDLSGEANSAALVATVRDQWGDPVAGQTVRIGAEGDAQQGLIAGGEVITGTTNAQGQLAATFTEAEDAHGQVGVRAELLVVEAGVSRVAHEDRKVIQFTEPPASGVTVLLPLIRR